jgi:hypothetical protein
MQTDEIAKIEDAELVVASALDGFAVPRQIAVLVNSLALVLAAAGVKPGSPAYISLAEIIAQTLPGRVNAVAAELREALG